MDPLPSTALEHSNISKCVAFSLSTLSHLNTYRYGFAIRYTYTHAYIPSTYCQHGVDDNKQHLSKMRFRYIFVLNYSKILSLSLRLTFGHKLAITKDCPVKH